MAGEADRSIDGKISCEMIGVKAGRWVGIRVHYTILSIFEFFYYENVLKAQYLLQKSVPLPMYPHYTPDTPATALHPPRHILCVSPRP